MLLTPGNPDVERDPALFARLGLRPMPVAAAEVDACSTTVHAGITCELVDGERIDGGGVDACIEGQAA